MVDDDIGDVAGAREVRRALEALQREHQCEQVLVRFEGRPWPASTRRFQLTHAGERELARLRGDTED